LELLEINSNNKLGKAMIKDGHGPYSPENRTLAIRGFKVEIGLPVKGERYFTSGQDSKKVIHRFDGTVHEANADLVMLKDLTPA